jgi:hypothetical protein
MTTFSETTLPALIFSVPAGHPKGDVPALGRLTVTEAQGADQWWLTWGCETNDRYTHTDSSGSGALFYEAEGRTVQSAAAIASASGVNASPAGSTTNNIVRHTALTTDYVSLLSTQAAGGGAHLTHVGSFRVYVRARTSALVGLETVSVALEWGVGDFRSFARNDAQTIPATDLSNWRLLDLGIVTIPKVLTGTQRWEGRILAKTTITGTDLDLDCLMFVPVDVASGKASALARAAAPTAFTALDGFDQAAGALTGKTAPTGGVWVGAGDASPDWVVGTGGIYAGDTAEATRTVVSGSPDAASTGRWVTLDINQTGTYVRSDMAIGTSSGASGLQSRFGLIARYIDSSNWLGFLLIVPDPFTASPWYAFIKRVAGTLTTIAGSSSTSIAFLSFNTPVELAMTVDSGGKIAGYRDGTLVLSGQDSAVATGGALASGDVGLYSEVTTLPAASNIIHYAGSFSAATYTSDAAIFASQSLDIRHDGVIREDSTGTTWQNVSDYEGDLLKVPVTGREGRSVRFIVKASRNPPTLSDPNIDDISATLAVTPRYLSVPAPA